MPALDARALETRRAISSAARERRSRRARKVPRGKLPRAAMLEYSIELARIAAGIVEDTRRILLPRLEEIARQDHRVDALAVRLDRIAADRLRALLDELSREIGRDVTPDRARRIASSVGGDVSIHSIADLQRQIRSAVGLDVFVGPGSTRMRERLGLFVEENASLISSIGDEHTRRVERVIRDAVRRGDRVEILQARIEREFDVVGSRAELIALDQILKAHGAFTEAAQLDAGIVEYTWATSNDERVRETHAALDGERFSWSSPPIVSSDGRREHPGGDFQCRCTATPVLTF